MFVFAANNKLTGLQWYKITNSKRSVMLTFEYTVESQVLNLSLLISPEMTEKQFM